MAAALPAIMTAPVQKRQPTVSPSKKIPKRVEKINSLVINTPPSQLLQYLNP